jgi:hypothetical protein
MKSLIFIWLVIISSSAISQIIAKTSSYIWTVTLEGSDNPYKEDCNLDLTASSNTGSFTVDFKHKVYNCKLRNPRVITVFPTENYSRFLVVIETNRGGDGDNSGPILSLYLLNQSGLSIISELQAYYPNFHRNQDKLKMITAKLLFGFQDGYDPDVINPKDNFYVPVKISLGCSALCISSTLNDDQKSLMRARYNKRKMIYKGDRNIDSLPKHMLLKEKEFLKILEKDA